MMLTRAQVYKRRRSSNEPTTNGAASRIEENDEHPSLANKIAKTSRKVIILPQDIEASGDRPGTSGFKRQIETTDENNSSNSSIFVTPLTPTTQSPLQPLQQVLQQQPQFQPPSTNSSTSENGIFTQFMSMVQLQMQQFQQQQQQNQQFQQQILSQLSSYQPPAFTSNTQTNPFKSFNLSQKLSKFSGADNEDYELWLTDFKARISAYRNLSEAEKIIEFQCHLEGKARS